MASTSIFKSPAGSQSSLQTDSGEELDDDFPYDLQDQLKHMRKIPSRVYYLIYVRVGHMIVFSTYGMSKYTSYLVVVI